MYPAVFQSRSFLSQAQDKQAHVILFPSSQAEAEAPLAALQLHHKTALQFTDENMSFLRSDHVLTERKYNTYKSNQLGF